MTAIEEMTIKKKLDKEALRQRNKERYQAMKDRPQDFPAWQHERWYSEKELEAIKMFGIPCEGPVVS